MQLQASALIRQRPSLTIHTDAEGPATDAKTSVAQGNDPRARLRPICVACENESLRNRPPNSPVDLVVALRACRGRCAALRSCHQRARLWGRRNRRRSFFPAAPTAHPIAPLPLSCLTAQILPLPHFRALPQPCPQRAQPHRPTTTTAQHSQPLPPLRLRHPFPRRCCCCPSRP